MKRHDTIIDARFMCNHAQRIIHNTESLPLEDRIVLFANKFGSPNVTTSKYLEDDTQEVRDVNILQFGCPIQLEVCFAL